MKIADAAIEILKRNGLNHVGYGWCDTLDDIAALANIKPRHPLNRHKSVLRALENDNRFEKKYFRANKGLARFFKLKKESKQ